MTLRRVERQHTLIEVLRRRRGESLTARWIAAELGVTPRTVERDVRRLRESGVPILVSRGPGGGYRFEARTDPGAVSLSHAEIAALIVSLSALGPTATDSAQSAMNKLVGALVNNGGSDGEARAGTAVTTLPERADAG